MRKIALVTASVSHNGRKKPTDRHFSVDYLQKAAEFSPNGRQNSSDRHFAADDRHEAADTSPSAC